MWQESRTEAEYVNWSPGQPDNSQVEDCVEKGRHYSELWNDIPCDYTSPHALCQAEK